MRIAGIQISTSTMASDPQTNISVLPFLTVLNWQMWYSSRHRERQIRLHSSHQLLSGYMGKSR